ncbi:MAG: RadC family protein [Sphingobacteriales bacterium]|jgi:DNA repair protein RadC
MKPAQAKNRPILEWAIDDRPREKLRAKGVKILSDTELLAILIQQGTRNRTAVDLARDVLSASKQNLKELGLLSMADLLKINGIGEAKATIILAALELGRRRQAAQNLEKPIVQGASSVASFLQTILQDHDHEVFIVLYLNRANKINHYEIVSSGGMSGTVADPRVILRRALEEKAVGIILCHNHPSGSLRPSHADRELTIKIREAARYFDILVLDHIIVSHEGFFSFAEEGLL